MNLDQASFVEAIRHRRTVYAINKTSPAQDNVIQEIVRTALQEVPSAFNSQSTRLVLLLREQHDIFWDIVFDVVKTRMEGNPMWEVSKKKLEGFKGGYGTVLCYEDQTVVEKLQADWTMYASYFPQWSEHTNAMHQFAIWTALSGRGFGCNLQHYNPLPNERAREIWGIPETWDLKAQLVFGGLESGAREALPVREKLPTGEVLRVYGAGS